MSAALRLILKSLGIPPIAWNNQPMNATKILWIRGKRDELVAARCSGAGISTFEYIDTTAAIARLPQHDYGVIVLEFPIVGWAPAALVEHVQRLAPGVPVLVNDPSATLNDAVRLARLGVHRFIEPPGDAGKQIEQVLEECRTRSLARLASRSEPEDWERLLAETAAKCGR